jgi:hypothetical protein
MEEEPLVSTVLPRAEEEEEEEASTLGVTRRIWSNLAEVSGQPDHS